MNRNVIWSPLAEIDFEIKLDYLQNGWDKQVAIRFLEKVELLIDQIALNPKQFPLVNKKRKIRKCVITKQDTIVYREHKGYIELLRIFDTRQNPRKVKYK